MPATATNSLGMRYATQGPQALVEMLNDHNRGFDYLFPRPSADIIPEVTPQGTVWRLRDPSSLARSRGAGSIAPFQLFPVQGAAKITCANGSVICGGKDLIPTIGGTSIIASPAPQLTVVTGTVYLHATVDSAGTPTALVIQNAASTPTDTSTEKYRTITSVVVSGTTVTIISPQNVQTALNLFLCNGTAVWERA